VIYVIGALALMLAISSGYGAWQHKAREVAEAQVGELQAQVGRQNDAVKVTKEEGDRRVSQATKGIAASAVVTQAAMDEAKRLRVLAESTLPPPTDCPAGAAVQQIRKGL